MILLFAVYWIPNSNKSIKSTAARRTAAVNSPKAPVTNVVVNSTVAKPKASNPQAAHRKLTRDGARWLKQTLDPFHDAKLEYVGLPDGSVSSSVVEHYTQSFQVTRPTASDGWGFSVTTMPFSLAVTPVENATAGLYPMMTGTGSPSTWYGSGAAANTQGTNEVIGAEGVSNGSGQSCGLVTIRTFNAANLTTSGGAFYPNGVATGQSITPDTIQTTSDNTFARGNRRLIGLAYEVCDVTSPMYKAGTGTHFRVPQAPQDIAFSGIKRTSFAASVNNGYPIVPVPYLSVTMPPADVAAAMLYDGTVQFPAADGCYCVAVHDPLSNKARAPKYNYLRLDNGDRAIPATNQLLGAASGLPDSLCSASYDATTTISSIFRPSYFHPNTFDTVGSYFTGLPQQGTYTVTVRTIWEVNPSPYDSNSAIIFAKPPPMCDPDALALYCAIACKLPAAVKFNENASGDFWDQVLSLIQSVAPALGYVGRSDLAALIAGGSKMIQAYRNRNDALEKSNVTRKMNL